MDTGAAGENLREVPSSGSAERKRHQFLVGWNETAADYPKDKCMHQLFEQRVQENPEAIALVRGAEQLTYGELNRRANRIARLLRTLGVRSNALVGICMHRRMEMIIGLLGSLKAGGAYVPLDPTYPRARLTAMMNRVELRVLLTTSDLVGSLPECRSQIVCVDQALPEIPGHSAGNLAVPTSPGDLCYVIFTSGSTGEPKAAAVLHRGWVNLVSWFVREFEIGAADKVLVISAFGFDITQRSIAMPLIAGGQLHLLASNLYDPELILRTTGEQQVTRLNCAPSTFYPLVEPPTQTAFESLSSLRTLFLGGEPISASRLRSWAEAATAEIANVYGAAECSDVSSFYRLRDYDRYVRTSVPIGKPIANSQIYLLDEKLEQVPVGDTGEICIGGVGVGDGYINDEELTAEKFVPDRFDDAPNARLYRTGDLARLAPDGNLEFVGRLDHQVKIRGLRIHLGDIEANLRQCPSVREAVVLKKQFAADDERLIAYVVPNEGVRAAAVDEARVFLRDRIPDYMVPSGFVLLEQLPLNPNGKVDRNALLSMEGVRTEPGAHRPETQIEREVAAIFADALKVDRIGRDDDFFNLGGDSLKAVLVVANVASRLRVSLPLEVLFETRTLGRFCQRVEAAAPSR